jgi:hypothetical protein
MSTAEEKCALLPGVTAVADVTGMKGILHRAAALTTNVQITLPLNATTGKPYLAGKWINIYADVANVQYGFGTTAAPTIVYNQLVTAGTGHVAAGEEVPAQAQFPILVPLDALYLSYICSVASGYVTIRCAEQLSGGL